MPDFFAFYRSMQAYEAGLRHNDTRMLLKPDSEFFRYFVDPSGKRDVRRASAGSVNQIGFWRNQANQVLINRADRLQGGNGEWAFGAMTDFVVALGLVFVLEGLLFAAFPDLAKKALHSVIETPDHFLRIVGISSAVVGVLLIWLIRG